MRLAQLKLTSVSLQKNEVFAETLARWIQLQGINATEAGPLLGVSHQSVYNWLAGDTVPPSTRIASLAAALGVDSAALRRLIDRSKHRRQASAARRRSPAKNGATVAPVSARGGRS